MMSSIRRRTETQKLKGSSLNNYPPEAEKVALAYKEEKNSDLNERLSGLRLTNSDGQDDPKILDVSEVEQAGEEPGLLQ